MTTAGLRTYALDILNEIDWLESIIRHRLDSFNDASDITALFPAPSLAAAGSYAKFLEERNYDLPERVALATVIASTWKPSAFLPLIEEANNEQKRCEFGGGIRDKSFRIVPTLRTIIFFLAGTDPELKAKYFDHFHSKHSLFTEGVITLSNPLRELSRLNFEPELNDQYLTSFLTGTAPRLDEGENFPAKLSQTGIEFDNVILNDRVRTELNDIIKYLRNRKKLFSLEGVERMIKTSYVVIFSGEPGTGKTITAKTIGKKLGIPVYIVNLARVVSKYIGETEKNLERVFDRFNGRDCILFFDEADALFGKRTEVKDAKDRYANQEVAFLLQKIEEFNGVVILATNVSDTNQTFDKAFQRRIRRNIKFEFPDHLERILLWEKSLPPSFTYSPDLIEKLAMNYQLTGASISNIIADTLIEAVDTDTRVITFELMEPFMRTEFNKTGRKMEVCTDEMARANPHLRFGTNLYKGSFG